MNRAEKIKQADLILQNYLENRRKNTKELRQLLLDIEFDLSQEEKSQVYSTKNIGLKNHQETLIMGVALNIWHE